MFCEKCGKQVQEDWSACPNCGVAINGGMAQPKFQKRKKRFTSGCGSGLA